MLFLLHKRAKSDMPREVKWVTPIPPQSGGSNTEASPQGFWLARCFSRCALQSPNGLSPSFSFTVRPWPLPGAALAALPGKAYQSFQAYLDCCVLWGPLLWRATLRLPLSFLLSHNRLLSLWPPSEQVSSSHLPPPLPYSGALQSAYPRTRVELTWTVRGSQERGGRKCFPGRTAGFNNM